MFYTADYFLAAAAVAATAYYAYDRAQNRDLDEWTPPRKGSRLDQLKISARLRDFFRLAIHVEEEGRKLYLLLAEYAKKPETRDICLRLAEAETSHRKLFETWLNKWEPLRPNRLEWPVLLAEVERAGIFVALPPRGAAEEELALYAVRQEVKTAEFYRMFETSFPDSWRRLKLHEIVLEELAHEKLIRSAYPHLPA